MENGTIWNIKIIPTKKGGEFGTFTFHNKKCGYIDCKSFNKEDIEDLKNLKDRDEIIIHSWFPKKESWIDKNGVKQYKTSIIVETIEVANRKSMVEVEPTLAPSDYNELDWDKEFSND